MSPAQRRAEVPKGAFALKTVEALMDEGALGGWHTINPLLGKLTRAQIAGLILAEMRDKRRPNLLKRLHQRFCTMRQVEEWVELATLETNPIPVNGFKWLAREIK